LATHFQPTSTNPNSLNAHSSFKEWQPSINFIGITELLIFSVDIIPEV